jgi:hypothetical protein
MRRSSARGGVNRDFDVHHLVITRVRICSDGFEGQLTRKVIFSNAVKAGKVRIRADSPRGWR